ncbi:hypothetical protein BJF85_07485 [Saccharomonospora sp. CUA-673]|uniref:helix-turn-helix domain-containing protein n=1 Tax=Saccharomonospora sp. CUA-673 TaxID=1904969 RepID=UPI0009653433|nr:helix-turn-helix transcriptional regulator [Saccharomonospora sp. CUA-673]OLT39051.1 hypothetical protein BJF85_07485 [Saccharomonospora sp. CUA-673]
MTRPDPESQSQGRSQQRSRARRTAQPAVPPESARLAETLGEIRSATRLSLAALAAKTPYSKSSWGRYLSGEAVPPRDAVTRLCALAGVEADRVERVVMLRDIADEARKRRAAAEAGTGATPPDPRPETESGGDHGADAAPASRGEARRSGYPTMVGVAVVSVVALVGVLAWGLLPGGDSGGESGEPGGGGQVAAGGDVEHAPSGARPGTEEGGPLCRGEECAGEDAETLACATVDSPPVPVDERRFAEGTVVKINSSPGCETVWARIDRGVIGDVVEVAGPDGEAGETQQALVRDEFDARGALATPMLAVPAERLDRVRACLVRDGERTCFTGG